MIESSSDVLFPQIEAYLAGAEDVILPAGEKVLSRQHSNSQVKVGVDLGTATLVMVVLDENDCLLAGEYQETRVVRDGLVVDFAGAVRHLREMKSHLEDRIGKKIMNAASGYPPGVPLAEVRANANVVDAAGMQCSGLIDEPSAANLVLQIRNGAIVDVGGGTTGVAVVEDGDVIYTADEATGGIHFSLVIAGAKGIGVDEAERMKINPAEQQALFPLVRPVMEKIASIIQKHITGYPVQRLFLVGGCSCFSGFDRVIQAMTGLPAIVPRRPQFVTPIGIAMNNLMIKG